MIIGVLSDTHMPSRAQTLPRSMLEAFKKTDMVIHCGDLVELSVLEEIKKVCPKITAVSGNMDSEGVRKKFPSRLILNLGAFKVAVTHGTGSPKNLFTYLEKEFAKDKPDLVIFGHSHTPTNEKRNGVLYFNPGSPTDCIFAPYRSYGIIEIDKEVRATIVKLEGD